MLKVRSVADRLRVTKAGPCDFWPTRGPPGELVPNSAEAEPQPWADGIDDDYAEFGVRPRVFDDEEQLAHAEQRWEVEQQVAARGRRIGAERDTTSAVAGHQENTVKSSS